MAIIKQAIDLMKTPSLLIKSAQDKKSPIGVNGINTITKNRRYKKLPPVIFITPLCTTTFIDSSPADYLMTTTAMRWVRLVNTLDT